MLAESARNYGAAYGRKSPGASAEKTEISVERQLEEIKARMAADGIQCVATFIDVHPRWELWERPQLTALRQLVKERAIDYVYTWDTSRLATGVKHQAILLDEGERYGVEWRFVNERLDHTSPLGQLLWSITSTFNTMELERIRDRTNGGRQKRLDKGKLPPLPCPPFGYRWPLVDGVANHDRLEPDPDQAPIVVRIYDESIRGISTWEIAARLDADGIAPPGRATRWHSTSICNILKNPLYKGQFITNKTRHVRQDGKSKTVPRDPSEWQTLPPEVCPSLVDELTWKRAQVSIAARQSGGRRLDRQNEGRFLLTGGLALCAGCGRPLRCVTVNRQRLVGKTVSTVYECPTRQELAPSRRRLHPERPACTEPVRTRGEALDQAVWEYVLDHASLDSAATDDATLAARRATLERTLRDAERRRLEAQKRIDRAAAELLDVETEEERVAIRAQQKVNVATKRKAEVDAERTASELARLQAQQDSLLSLYRTMAEERVTLLALGRGQRTPETVADMRGLLEGLGVRVAVGVDPRGKAYRVGRRDLGGEDGLPPFWVAPWQPVPPTCTLLASTTSGGAQPQTGAGQDGHPLAALLHRLARQARGDGG